MVPVAGGFFDANFFVAGGAQVFTMKGNMFFEGFVASGGGDAEFCLRAAFIDICAGEKFGILRIKSFRSVSGVRGTLV